MAFFEKSVERWERIALIKPGKRSYTYREMFELGNQLLADIPRRSVIFVMAENSVEGISVYVCALQRQIVPVMIHCDISVDKVEKLREQYQPKYCVHPKDYKGICGEEIAKTGSYVTKEMPDATDYEIHDELALLLTTSGSTGSPKLVRQSYKNLDSNAKSIATYLDIGEDDIAITTLPLNYTYGLSIINSHLEKGAAIVISNHTFFDKEFWEECRIYKVTNFGGVPYSYDMLMTIGFEHVDVSSLRYLTQAGGKLHEEKVKRMLQICQKKGIKFIIMYGQTEATAGMSWLPWEDIEKKSGSIGIAIPGGKFSLIDFSGNEIREADTPGELVYSGDNVTLGYAEDYSDLSKGDERGGLLHTGDIAKRDADGYYYIVGRKKRFVKLFGNRINLDEVESMLAAYGIEAVCGGQDDCMVVYTTEKDVEERIYECLCNELKFHRNAFRVRTVKEIPRNDSGKVDYVALQEV